MDLRSLRHAVVLGRLLNYTKAAEELAMSQPALTRSIQMLEQRAEVRLFDRDRGGVHLTRAGRMFVERAAAVLRDVDDLNRVLKRAAGGAEGKVAFGMGPHPAAALLPGALANSVTSQPELRSEVMVRRADALLELLRAEKIEFFVCAENQILETEPVKSSPLGRFETCLIVRAGHPLLASDAEGRGRRYPLITAGPVGRELPSAIGRVPFLEPEPQTVVEDYGVLARMTELSDAVWLSSSMVAAKELQQGSLGVVPRDLWNERQTFRVMLYSLDRRSLSPAARTLMAHLQDQIRALARLDLW